MGVITNAIAVKSVGKKRLLVNLNHFYNGQPYGSQVVNPLHQTPVGQTVAKRVQSHTKKYIQLFT